MDYLLETKDLTKKFPGVIANDKINLKIKKGEIHSLLGENGAGKSTLMNCIYGLYKPDDGQMIYKGKEVEINSPQKAIEIGIGMVHQHFMLIPALTVIENIVLGLKVENAPYLDLKKEAKKVKELAKEYGLNVDMWSEVRDLSVGEQQRVEIIKALYRDSELLILDEPTAVLTPQESEDLFKVLKKLSTEGLTIIFITHKLKEVIDISDNITVLRNGKKVDTIKNENLTTKELACLMVGREILFEINKSTLEKGEAVLELENILTKEKSGDVALRNISLKVNKGEILGVAGVDGNGQSELAEVIAGLRKIENGKVIINGKNKTNSSPRDILEEGVSHVPEDRHKDGLVLNMSIKENSFLQTYYRRPFSNGPFLDWDFIKDYTKNIVNNYDVRTPNIEIPVKNLSGGNQQKLIFGRELERNPELLLAVSPTRGLDVGAIEYVQEKIIEVRDSGSAVLMISMDLDEILNLSDRIIVLYEGEVVGHMKNDGNIDIKELGAMMCGEHCLIEEGAV